MKYFERLVGDLDDTYFITLVGALHDKEQLHPRVKHVERTQPNNELVEYYTQADIIVNPTVYDNFPTVNIEAQACGTPVITFDTGGSGESIVEGKTGKIISTSEYDVLLKEIIEFPKKSKNIEKNFRIIHLNFLLTIC